MPKINVYSQSFNVGVVDAERLSRIDLERMRLAAEEQTNLLPTVAGNMFLRPGLEYIARTTEDKPADLREFVFGADDAALLEFTGGEMRVYVDDERIFRPAVSTLVNRGNFTAVGDWLLTSSAGATSSIAGNTLQLTAAANGSKATARQEVPVAVDDRGVEHSLLIQVARGPVTFRCGSNTAGDQYIAETELKTGNHSLSFTPTEPTFWLFFQTTSEARKIVQNCQIEGLGNMRLATPWNAADITKLSMTQSADVIFVACDGRQQRRIERRGRRSWSIVQFQPEDGPFMVTRSAPVRLKPSVTRGNGTLTASDNFFRPSHVGALFRLFHDGQNIIQSLAGEQVFTDPIRVTGINNGSGDNDRNWVYSIAGTWSGTVTVQRSFDSETYGYKPYRNSGDSDTIGQTGNVTGVSHYDEDNNAIIYYRLAFQTGEYTSGTADVTISYDGGGGYGICRVTGFIDKTTVSIETLKPFKNTAYTTDWKEGMWSAAQGFPSAVGLSEGRLFQAGNDKFWASVSDAYESYDEEIEGDSGAISRSIAIGSVNQVQWILPLQRVVFGTNGSEVLAKSSSLDEPLSPTNISLKSSSSVGSGPVVAVRVDGSGIFVDRPTRALFELAYDASAGDYVSAEMTRLCASWFNSGIVKLAISRRPDTRVWAVLADGTCMCMVYEPRQEVVAFVPVVTDGRFESVAVLPGGVQDNVYFIVARDVNGATQRHIEKMSRDDLAVPGLRARVMDAQIIGTNAPASVTITGLSHLIGRQVKVWADGAPFNQTVNNSLEPRLFTVSEAGTITLPIAVGDYCVGLPYQGRFKSSRLAYGAAGGTAIMQKQTVKDFALLMSNYARSGIRYGSDFDRMWPLPAEKDYHPDPTDIYLGVEEERNMTMYEGWTTDSRLHLTVNWPANVLGMVFQTETNG